MWSIISQIEKHGKIECEVGCKQVKFFPVKDKKSGELTGFGALKNLCLKILFRHDKGLPHEFWQIVYGVHGFNITCPDRMEFVNKWSDEKKRVKGRAFGGNPTSGSMNEARFIIELKSLVGQDFTDEVCGLFFDKIEEIKAKAEQREKNKADKLAKKSRKLAA